MSLWSRRVHDHSDRKNPRDGGRGWMYYTYAYSIISIINTHSGAHARFYREHRHAVTYRVNVFNILFTCLPISFFSSTAPRRGSTTDDLHDDACLYRIVSSCSSQLAYAIRITHTLVTLGPISDRDLVAIKNRLLRRPNKSDLVTVSIVCSKKVINNYIYHTSTTYFCL